MSRLLNAALLVLIAALLIVSTAGARGDAPRRGTIAFCKRYAGSYEVRNACIIRVVFAPVGQSHKAVKVAFCESGFRPYAENGQYLGVFQLGKRERARYGHGPLVEQQAKAALKLWRERGWSPWSCA